nr:hypothetical protein [Tanacetum cinerariifolium]
GEGSSTPTEPHHTLFPEVASSHPTTSSIPLPSIPTALIPTVNQPDTAPIIQYSRRARIAQSSALPTEAASPVRDVSEGEACPTNSGFIADRDMATIAKSSTLPHDSAPRAQEEEIGRLKERVQVLEDREAVATKQFGEDAPIKGRSTNEGEAAAERISNDSEEIAKVLISMDAATVLAGETDVPTGSGFIPTAGPPATVISTSSEVGPTASPIVIRRKGKEVMVKSDTLKKKKLQEQIDAQVARELEEQQERQDMRMNEQIARDAKVARIHTEEEIQELIEKANFQEAEEGILYGCDQKQLGLEVQRFQRQYTRRTRIAQSSALPPVADEPASPVRDDSQGEACPTDSGYIADQDRATIAKSSTLPHDSARQVTSPATEEDTQEVEINRLKERVKTLEDNQGVIGARSRDDAPIKGRRIDEEEVATERLSSHTEEVRLDEEEVAAERTKVPTGSGSIPTTGAEVPTGSDVVPTASLIFATATVVTPYRRRKGKEVMVESETPKKQKV